MTRATNTAPAVLEAPETPVRGIDREALKQLDDDIAARRAKAEREAIESAKRAEIKKAEPEPAQAAPTIREFLDSCTVKAGHTHILEGCQKYGISLDSPWPPKFPEEGGREPERQTAIAPQPKKPPAQPVQLPLPFGDNTRAVSNPLVRSALFAAIQGKDRQLLNNCEIATVDGWKMNFSGEQWNQDDKDTFMQLVFMARYKPFGEYVTAPAHAILKGLGRDVGGKAHQTLKGEIERVIQGTLKFMGKNYDYIGHLIEDAIQDKTSRHWAYRLNPAFAPLFAEDSYTLIDWEQRKKLKGKDLARWLQLELATHAAPFARSVGFYREKSGSTAKSLRHFREALRRALDALKTNGDIAGWSIDAADLVQIDRKPSPAQLEHLNKTSRRKPKK